MDQDKLPLVTAVIPVYNHERYVVESIRSIVRQSYPNIELIIINDGSKDRSHEMVLTLVEECKGRFTRFEYINRENRGLSATLNQALGMTQGKYFSALASDDVALPNKFRWLVEALELGGEGCAAAFGNAEFIDGDGRTVYLDVAGKTQEAENDKTYSTFLDYYTRERDFDYRTEFGSYRTLLGGNYLPAMSHMLRTDCVRGVDGWTAGNVLEDWEMWLKISKQKKLLYVNKAVALYRMHGLNSYDTMKQKMVRASLILVEREKEYCVRKGLMSEWNESFNGFLWWILKYGDSSLTEKLRELRFAELLPLASHLLKARSKQLSEKIVRTSA
jgi:alpha-1,3-rhamnosyltransferase